MMGLSNILIPAVLFFLLGFLARIARSDLHFPPDLAKVLAVYLLVAIGIHGGHELGLTPAFTILNAIVWAIVLGCALPLIAYPLLLMSRKVNATDAAAIAAHYGSVSVGTFMTARAYLDAHEVSYETHPLIMLAAMEAPAIVVGLLLAAWARRQFAESAEKPAVETRAAGLAPVLKKALLNGSVVLLTGSMLIGALVPAERIEALHPFTHGIFMGALCLFLLDMGLEAGRRIGESRGVGLVLLGFGVVMPLIGGLLGALVGHAALGLGVGGTTLVAVLAASASYIAVPPAMRLAIPEANPSLYLTLSLGVTFPFNVMIGIPLYHRLASAVVSG
jgi:uncharacterized protein